VELLSTSKVSQTEIIKILSPSLNLPDARNAARAAYVILGLAPNHKEALATLTKYAQEGNIADKVSNAGWLWERTRDPKIAVPILVEALRSGDDFACQVAPQILSKIGRNAQAATPALKAALWNPFGREQAAKALRIIAPEELPPVH
jgi:hypothetical protein